MKLTKLALVGAAVIRLNATAVAQTDLTGTKVYECAGETMELKKLPDGRIALEGKMLTGYVSVHQPTGMYRGAVEGWGSQHKTPGEALDAACLRLVERTRAETGEDLKETLDKFYEDWK